jgi:antitoxin component of MazEF toxin-antitoxin module
MQWTREIAKCGGSHVVRLPKAVLEGLGWEMGDKVLIELDNSELCIRKAGKK